MKTFVLLAALCASLAVSAQTPRDVSRDMKYLDEHMSEFMVKVYALGDPTNPEKSMGTGSGELVRSTDGVIRILTNHHVVGDLAETVYVHFDGAPFAQKVRVIGRDPFVDLALLEAPSSLPSGTTPIVITAKPLAVGDTVYALGYPKGSRNISMGYINSRTSHLEEQGVGIYATHQSPISPGSSGGILVRFNGLVPELVGINTMVGLQRTGNAVLVTNMGFSIKPEVIDRMIAKLETGQVAHAYAGAVFADTSFANPYAYELGTKQSYPPQQPGIMVVRVEPDSPALRAGLERGDMIRKFEMQSGEKWVAIQTPTASSLRDKLFFSLPPGTVVRFTTTRGTQEVARTLTLERSQVPEKQKNQE